MKLTWYLLAYFFQSRHVQNYLQHHSPSGGRSVLICATISARTDRITARVNQLYWLRKQCKPFTGSRLSVHPQEILCVVERAFWPVPEKGVRCEFSRVRRVCINVWVGCQPERRLC